VQVRKKERERIPIILLEKKNKNLTLKFFNKKPRKENKRNERKKQVNMKTLFVLGSLLIVLGNLLAVFY